MKLSEKPEIAALWHPTKNGDLTPEDVTTGGSKKVWWLCPESGGEYNKSVAHQVLSGPRSPYMTGKKALRGYNDLGTTHPEVAELWHPTKNKMPNPDVRHGSQKKAWWICPVTKEEYERSIQEQVVSGPRSPYVTGKRVLVGYNDLGSTHPDVAELWDYNNNGDLTPEHITSGSKKRPYWICPETQESYQRLVQEQVQAGATSPYMQNQKVLSGYNDLESQHPEIAALWHPIMNNGLMPDEVISGSGRKVYWLCPVTNKEYKKSIVKHIFSGPVSPFLSNQKILVGYNDLLTTHPDIAKDWHTTLNGDFSPEMITAGNGKKKVHWLCPDSGESYIRTVQDQVKRGGVSPFVFGTVILTGFNDLETLHPNVVSAWDYDKNKDMIPSTTSPGCEKKAWFICPKTGRSFQRSIAIAVKTSVFHPVVSAGEQELLEFIETVCNDVKTGDRKIIAPLELDITIPNKMIAIEYNGIYWHSEAKGKDEYYHHNKWRRSMEAGYRLINVWEDDWKYNQGAVKSTIISQLGVLDQEISDDCEVLEISPDIAKTFLENNHIDGYNHGDMHYGIYDNDELISVSVWSASSGILHLSRFSSLYNVNTTAEMMVGKGINMAYQLGCSLIQLVSKHDYDNGTVWESIGFFKSHDIKPRLDFIKKGGNQRQSIFLKSETDQLKSHTEGISDPNSASGFFKVWDSGSTLYTMSI